MQTSPGRPKGGLLARGISPGGSARLSSSLADDRCPGGSSGWDEPGAWSTVATLRRELNLSDGTLSLAAGAIDALPEPAFGHLVLAMRSHLDQQTVAFTDALGEALYTAPTVDRVFEAEHAACVPAGPCVRGEGPVWGRPVGDEGCSLLEYACLPPGWEAGARRSATRAGARPAVMTPISKDTECGRVLPVVCTQLGALRAPAVPRSPAEPATPPNDGRSCASTSRSLSTRGSGRTSASRARGAFGRGRLSGVAG